MTPDSAVDLRHLLGGCAHALRDACVARTGMAYATASSADRLFFRAPALVNGLRLEGMDLNELPKLLYATEPAAQPEQVLETWRRLVEMVDAPPKRARVVLDMLQEVFPGVPFTRPTGGDMRTEMIQFLRVAGWQMGWFRANDNYAKLTLGNKVLRVNPQSIEWPGGYRRTKRPLRLIPVRNLHVMLGEPKAARLKTSGMYRYLVRTLPDLTAQITVAVQTALFAGPEFEELLASPFDLPLVRDGKAMPEAALIWEDALRLLDSSAGFPGRQLSAMLIPIIGHDAYISRFGRTIDRHNYAAATRQKHRDRLVLLQTKYLDAARDHSTQDATALIELQQLIRSI